MAAQNPDIILNWNSYFASHNGGARRVLSQLARTFLGEGEGEQ
jgi:hypothetical protein